MELEQNEGEIAQLKERVGDLQQRWEWFHLLSFCFRVVKFGVVLTRMESRWKAFSPVACYNFTFYAICLFVFSCTNAYNAHIHMYVGKQLQVFKSFFSLILECNSVNKMFCELCSAAQFSNIPTKCGYYVSFPRTSLYSDEFLFLVLELTIASFRVTIRFKLLKKRYMLVYSAPCDCTCDYKKFSFLLHVV